MKTCRAFSLVELIIVVLVIAALSFIAVPRLQFGALRRKQADTVAHKIVTDLRRTRGLAISDAANNTKGYELKMVGTSPYTAYEIENMHTHQTVDSFTIDSNINVSCTSFNRFKFGPLGSLQTGSGSGIIVSSDEDKSFTITVIPATGTVKCVEN
jgi:prepilin-type N-terminal cleavage/methylation domain-containing protein